MPQATLINKKTGQKQVVESGSQDARKLMGQGFDLFTEQPAPAPNPFQEILQAQLSGGNPYEKTLAARASIQQSLLSQQPFADALKTSLSQADSTEAALRKEKNMRQEELGNIYEESRKRYKDIRNPFERQALINRDYNSKVRQIQDVSDLVERRGASQADILNKGLGGFQNMLQAQQAGLQGFESDLAFQRQQQLARGSGGGGGGGGTPVVSEELDPNDPIVVAADAIAKNQAKLTDFPQDIRASILSYMQQSGVSGVPAKARDALAKIAPAEGIINRIEELSHTLNNAPTGASLVSGGFASLFGKLGQGNAAAAMADLRRSVAGTLARSFGEVGVLTDQDIARAQALIPSPFDSTGRAQQKIAQLRGMFGELKQKVLDAYSLTPDQLTGGTQAGPTPDPLGLRPQ